MTIWKVDHLGSIFLKIKKDLWFEDIFDHLGLIFLKIKKDLWFEDIFDHFSWTSSENSDVESFCPHDGHLPP